MEGEKVKDQWFEIPGRLAGANEYILANRSHIFAGAKMKKEQNRICAEASIVLKPINWPVKITVTWFEPNARRDYDNISFGIKWILDGLVEAGKLPDDRRKWVKGIAHEFPEPDKKNPRVVVWLQEYKEAGL